MRWIHTIALVAVTSFTFPSAAQAKQVELDVAMANPTMLVPSEPGDGKKVKQENYLRIGLTGFELPSASERQPVNVAIVIDKSGSMRGDKIVQARKAAVQALERLHKDDIVSVIAYDSSVSVIVPATKATDRDTIRTKIDSIAANGNTALFAGVSKAAGELRKFLNENTVNRVILLSDGQANVGPSSPRELEQLGASLIKEGISVTTMGLGLGYNEDLMSSLALASSGNHVFIEDAENLVQVFQNEFDDVLSVVAKKIRIEAKLAEGVRPVKVLNYEADIVGQVVSLDLGQLYSRQERYFVIEVEVTCGDADSTKPIADVGVEYLNLITETKDKLASSIEVKFSDSEEIAEAAVDKNIMAACLIQVANQRNRRATELRDQGRIDEARNLLLINSNFLGENFQKYQLPELQLRCELNTLQSEMLESDKWGAGRKLMRQQQFQDLSQQRYSGTGEKSDFNKKQ
ncbi:MAG: VWA domain-containing protein [Aureliella sp.]